MMNTWRTLIQRMQAHARDAGTPVRGTELNEKLAVLWQSKEGRILQHAHNVKGTLASKESKRKLHS